MQKKHGTYDGQRYCFFFPFPFFEDFSLEYTSSIHKENETKKKTASKNFILKVKLQRNLRSMAREKNVKKNIYVSRVNIVG